MAIEEDEPRVDGRHLKPLDEEGSDELLSDEVKAKIAEVIEHYEDHHRSLRERLHDRRHGSLEP